MQGSNTGVFLDRTMNRQQNRAARSVLRRAARAKNPDPLAVMTAFSAARSRGWAGPDTKKAVTFRKPCEARPRAAKTVTGHTKVWTKKQAARFKKYRTTLAPYPPTGAHAK